MKNNDEILLTRYTALNKQQGARVGDFLKLTPPDPRCPNYTRFTHDWGDTIQTGGTVGGSYYLANGFLSYSGGLDPGIATADLILTDEVKDGHVWFFDEDISGAGRGLTFDAQMRVFIPRPGADLSGIEELKCPYWLSCLDQEQHERTCGYWFTVTRNAMAHTAFALKEQLEAWLVANRLKMMRPIEYTQRLEWA